VIVSETAKWARSARVKTDGSDRDSIMPGGADGDSMDNSVVSVDGRRCGVFGGFHCVMYACEKE
jgi:hypothetical protein